jgi:amino acid transporter
MQATPHALADASAGERQTITRRYERERRDLLGTIAGRALPCSCLSRRARRATCPSRMAVILLTVRRAFARSPEDRAPSAQQVLKKRLRIVSSMAAPQPTSEPHYERLFVEAPPKRTRFVRTLVGRPMASREIEETLLPKWLALPIFSSDAISSVAYATEAAMVVLVAASLSALHYVIPISIGIAVLLGIVTLSYRQTVHAYETSGGAYVVARENLGVLPSLVAGASLLTDYILTVAVSVSSGVLAITSAARFLHGWEVLISVAVVIGIMVINLRGVRESGVVFALPTYAFIGVLLTTIAVGSVKCATGSCPHAVTPNALPAGAGTVTLFVLLRAFASGSSALTGVEAIANGVNAFRRPQSRNAGRTLLFLGGIAITLFLGVSYLANATHARPSSTDSVLSQIGRAVFPTGSSTGFVYYLLQAFTFAILIFAANTSFQGFPRLAALLAADRYFPRQFVNMGDRLVYSNGIFVLTAIATALIVLFKANVNSLIHLYVVGVFTAFTISQTGMVRYWFRRRDPGWRLRAGINATGAVVTGIVTIVVILTKFLEGAWIVIVAIPLLVAAFYGIHRHYAYVARRLAAGVDAVKRARMGVTNEVIVPVNDLDAASRVAVWYARAIVGKKFHGVHVATNGRDPRGNWWDFSGGSPPLELLDSSTGRWTEAVREYVWRLPRGEASFVTVVVAEQFERPTLREAFRSRESFTLNRRLLAETGIAVANVTAVGTGQRTLPKRLVSRVLVSGAHAATLRAVNYVDSLGIGDSSAVYFAYDDEHADQLCSEWHANDFVMPLDVEEAAYRDIGQPLLQYVRRLTADGETLAVLVMPEVVVAGWRELLHNQRSLYVKRLLLFEPNVVLTSVPFQIIA